MKSNGRSYKTAHNLVYLLWMLSVVNDAHISKFGETSWNRWNK